MAAFRAASNHPVDLADGRVVAKGEIVEGLDASNPHNAALVESGALSPIPAPPKKAPAKGAKTNEGGSK